MTHGIRPVAMAAAVLAISVEITFLAWMVLETLRDLARGIFPPLLAERGLGAALESQARKDALGGSLSVTSVLGGGATLAGRIPVYELAAA